MSGEPRWRVGVPLGRKWGTSMHLVYDPEDEQVHEVRATQRRPSARQWSLEALQAVKAVPLALRRPATTGDSEALDVTPPVEQPELLPPPAPAGRAPTRVFSEDGDLRTFGCTANWPNGRRRVSKYN